MKAQQSIDKEHVPPAQRDEVIRPSSFSPATGAPARRRLVIRPAMVLVMMLLSVAMVIGWYLFTARSVIISPDPAGAEITVSGGFSFKLGEHYLMREGQYQLLVKASGYYPLQQQLPVNEQQNQSHEVSLIPLPGHLQLSISPVASVEVWIDDKPWALSGNTLRDIPAGDHQLVVKAPRFLVHEQPIEIEGRDTSQSLAITLDPAWADMTLNSEPAGATVTSDGDIIGTTPLSFELLEGERQLTVSLDGYKIWQQQLNVVAGTSLSPDPIMLEKADGRLTVASVPNGASITINGQYQGQTPLQLSLSPGKDYQISLYKDGYQMARRQTDIVSGDNPGVSITLKPVLGTIKISSRHQNALLYLDNRLMGRVNQTLSLPAREFELKITKEGFVDYVTTVLARPGLEQLVEVNLKTLEQDKWDNIQTTIELDSGIRLKLFRPDLTFTMGASRREQGRRSNENLHRVSLKRAFYLAEKETTNAQFRKFLRLHSSSHVKGNSLNGDKYPVVNLSWQQAALFCNWLSEQEKLPLFYQVENEAVVGFNPGSNGYRLPSEAEWGWVARYQDGVMAKYSWGKQLPPSPGSGNFADRSGAALLGKIQVKYTDNYPVTAPVGSFSPNRHGIFDMAGNVAEWINDFYEIKSSRQQKPPEDPLGKTSGEFHVIRGSSWAHGTMTDLRMAFRDYGTEARNDVGFRIARYVE